VHLLSLDWLLLLLLLLLAFQLVFSKLLSWGLCLLAARLWGSTALAVVMLTLVAIDGLLLGYVSLCLDLHLKAWG
jgi:hypothetical protein